MSLAVPRMKIQFAASQELVDLINREVRKLVEFRDSLPEVAGYHLVDEWDPPMAFGEFPAAGAITVRFRYEPNQ